MYINYSICSQILFKLHDIVPRNILHIGAHKGEEVAGYSENGAEQVIWFEANEEIIPDLTNHLNQFKLNQQVIPIALWDKNEVKNLIRL